MCYIYYSLIFFFLLFKISFNKRKFLNLREPHLKYWVFSLLKMNTLTSCLRKLPVPSIKNIFISIFFQTQQSFAYDISSGKLSRFELWICCDGGIQFHFFFSIWVTNFCCSFCNLSPKSKQCTYVNLFLGSLLCSACQFAYLCTVSHCLSYYNLK